MSAEDSPGINLPAAVVTSSGSVAVPANFVLAPPEDRRMVPVLELFQDSHQGHNPGTFALYAVMDFASKEVGPRLAVIDEISTGYPLLGLCFLNTDGTYTRHSGGRRLPVNKNDFMTINKFSPGEVILRVGEVSLELGPDPAAIEPPQST